MEKTDEDLINGCRQGDAKAWNALVGRYQRLIYTIPLRAGLDEDGAADVFQQVFTALIENLERIREPSRIQAWLVTCAKRETLQVLRRGNPARFVVIDDDSDGQKSFELSDSSPLPVETLEKSETEHQVRTAVAELDERCGQLLTLLFYEREQNSYAEIAAALGISEGSIGPTRARCLEKLSKKLKKIGF